MPTCDVNAAANAVKQNDEMAQEAIEQAERARRERAKRRKARKPQVEQMLTTAGHSWWSRRSGQVFGWLAVLAVALAAGAVVGYSLSSVDDDVLGASLLPVALILFALSDTERVIACRDAREAALDLFDGGCDVQAVQEMLVRCQRDRLDPLAVRKEMLKRLRG